MWKKILNNFVLFTKSVCQIHFYLIQLRKFCVFVYILHKYAN